jgi:hypothetical protein
MSGTARVPISTSLGVCRTELINLVRDRLTLSRGATDAKALQLPAWSSVSITAVHFYPLCTIFLLLRDNGCLALDCFDSLDFEPTTG